MGFKKYLKNPGDNMKKVCVFTGTRAEYGLLKPLMKKIKEHKKMKLQIIVSGMHLSSEFGETYKEIEKDGFSIDEKIEILLSSDTKKATCKSMGLGMISYSDAIDRLKPDLMILLGDRFESFCIATAANIMNVPIAHLHGGESTQAQIDEFMRHSITKMSYLHFTSTEDYKKRVIQLGENPDRVFNVGAIGVENIKNIDLLDKKTLEDDLMFSIDDKTILFTYHPITLNNNQSKKDILEILDILDKFKDLKVIFTKANADSEGRIINACIENFIKNKKNMVLFDSLGSVRYLSLLQYVKAVLGNSSSGILEAPSFGIKTINIGNRQKGRVKSESIIDIEIIDLYKTLESILNEDNNKLNIKNPYYKENTTNNIIKIIEDFLFNKKINLEKKFYDIDFYY